MAGLVWRYYAAPLSQTNGPLAVSFQTVKYDVQLVSERPLRQHGMRQCVETIELAQPSPVDSMREAVFTVSPNRQYLGIACPTTPVYSIRSHVQLHSGA